ncbi:hypothetical protein [Paraburkholderia sp. BL6665CI2N2]|uniref:hypothetical protein n=1 Tax=Paraburkholderia sp. BL6665CI2N2 TaxID=1938806 RepID=UPI001FBB2BEF|nr:hypothetical protein [Paraburkholderia sp. BL6665CI2N2]
MTLAYRPQVAAVRPRVMVMPQAQDGFAGGENVTLPTTKAIGNCIFGTKLWVLYDHLGHYFARVTGRKRMMPEVGLRDQPEPLKRARLLHFSV